MYKFLFEENFEAGRKRLQHYIAEQKKIYKERTVQKKTQNFQIGDDI